VSENLPGQSTRRFVQEGLQDLKTQLYFEITDSVTSKIHNGCGDLKLHLCTAAVQDLFHRQPRSTYYFIKRKLLYDTYTALLLLLTEFGGGGP